MARRLSIMLMSILAVPAWAGDVTKHSWWIGRDNVTGARSQSTVYYVGAAADVTAITAATVGDLGLATDTGALYSWNGATWVLVGGGSGAPTTAQYWTGAADAGLSAEHNLGALSTGLVINTTGTPSAYAGTSCTNQFPRSLSASGAATCASVDLTNDVTGTLPVGNLTDDASSGLCLLSGGAGDPAWTTCPGGGGGLSYAQVSASALAGF